jgi:hypothetical protein
VIAIVLALLTGLAVPSMSEARPPRHKAASRAAHARPPRHQAAKRAFERQTGYPHGRPGYVVDHITPLACGGADVPSNMQWQPIAEARAKDKIERKGPGCR